MEKTIDHINDSLIDNVLKFFIYVTIVLPAGAIFGINLKMLSLGLFLFLLALDRKNNTLSKTIISIMPIIFFITLESLYSYSIFKYDDSFIFSQAKDIFVFFLMFYILIYYSEFNNKYNLVADTIVKGVFLVGLLKLFILLYSFYSNVPVSFLIVSISEFLNVPIMTYDVEDSYIARINFTSDLILPIVIFYLFMKFYKLNLRKFDIFLILIILFSALITMSRYQWAFSLVAILLSIFLNINNKRSFISLVFLFSLGFFSLTLKSVQEALLFRFDEKTVSSSDIERMVQKQRITESITDAPLFGNGIGYYMPDLVRSETLKYSYELQIHALIMQLGFFGTIVILLMILFPLIKSGRNLSIKIFISYIILIGFWISSALFNPMLFSSSAGIAMAFLFLISKMSWLRKT